MAETTKKPTSKRDSDTLEKFERKFVFRTARGYFLFLAGAAILTFVTGVFFGARGIVRVEPAEPSEPTIPEPPTAPKPLALSDVETWIAKQSEGPTEVAATDEPEWVAAAAQDDDDPKQQENPEAKRFDELLEKFKTLFPEPQYAWKDTYVRTCARSSPYGCLRYDRKLEKEGVSKILENAIREELRGDSLSELNAILSTLVGVLEAAAVERRAELIAPTAEAYRELQGGYRQLVREHQREVATIRAEYEMKLLEHEEELQKLREEKESDMMSGVYGVLAGLGLLVLVSVFLAHFAIERHLRLVREALAGRET